MYAIRLLIESAMYRDQIMYDDNNNNISGLVLMVGWMTNDSIFTFLYLTYHAVWFSIQAVLC